MFASEGIVQYKEGGDLKELPATLFKVEKVVAETKEEKIVSYTVTAQQVGVKKEKGGELVFSMAPEDLQWTGAGGAKRTFSPRAHLKKGVEIALVLKRSKAKDGEGKEVDAVDVQAIFGKPAFKAN